MKTQLMKTISVIAILLTTYTVNAISYPTYQPTQQVGSYRSYSTPVRTTNSGMVTSYRSTSAMNIDTLSLSGRSNSPMLNENGIAIEPYASVNGPRRAAMDDDDNDDDDSNIPTGSGTVPPPLPIGSILVLLLFALMHVGYIAYTTSVRKQK